MDFFFLTAVSRSHRKREELLCTGKGNKGGDHEPFKFCTSISLV